MEIIDLYNDKKEKLGKTFVRYQDTLLDGEFYLLEQAWIINNKNEILLTRRGYTKKYGGMWEATTGHVISGESDVEGIIREIHEEIGLNLEKKDLKFLKSIVNKHLILDVWLIQKDIDIKDISLIDNEAIDVKYVTIDKFKEMLINNEIVSNLDYFIDLYNEIIKEK